MVGTTERGDKLVERLWKQAPRIWLSEHASSVWALRSAAATAERVGELIWSGQTGLFGLD
jgi:hypothetical protein